eukprot:2599427-Alexandrium_andersonii.AAC.1
MVPSPGAARAPGHGRLPRIRVRRAAGVSARLEPLARPASPSSDVSPHTATSERAGDPTRPASAGRITTNEPAVRP